MKSCTFNFYVTITSVTFEEVSVSAMENSLLWLICSTRLELAQESFLQTIQNKSRQSRKITPLFKIDMRHFVLYQISLWSTIKDHSHPSTYVDWSTWKYLKFNDLLIETEGKCFFFSCGRHTVYLHFSYLCRWSNSQEWHTENHIPVMSPVN